MGRSHNLTALALLGWLASAVTASITTDSSIASGQTFDYIIVGGGLTGTTVASRLAEDAALKILVVEVGGDDRLDPNVYDIYNYKAAFGSPLDWAWPTDRGKVIHGYVWRPH